MLLQNVTEVSQVSMASRHLLDVHKGNTSTFSFMGIERVHLSARGGDLNKQLLLIGIQLDFLPIH